MEKGVYIFDVVQYATSKGADKGQALPLNAEVLFEVGHSKFYIRFDGDKLQVRKMNNGPIEEATIYVLPNAINTIHIK